MTTHEQQARQQGKLQTTIDRLCTEIYEGRSRVTILGRTKTLINHVIKPRVLKALELKGIQVRQDFGDHVVTGICKVICFRSLEDYQQILEQDPTTVAILD